MAAKNRISAAPPAAAQNSDSDLPEVPLRWENFLEGRKMQPDIPVENGLKLLECLIPEPVLESILCRLPDNEILKCNLVCRAWKDLLTRKSFWKKCFNYENTNWDSVPLRVKEKPGGWMVLYAQLRHSIFSRNFIRNPSGHLQFEGWTITRDGGGDNWELEETPKTCNPLLKLNSDDMLSSSSCWSTTLEWCSKYYEIDLWNEGVTPAVMKVCLPVEIKCSQMYTSRSDCGGKFRWKLELLDNQREVISVKRKYMHLPAKSDWHVAEYSFNFFPTLRDLNVLDKVRFLRFTHTGRDTEWWEGHFGMKFARSSVTLKCLDKDAVEESENDNGEGYVSSGDEEDAEDTDEEDEDEDN